MRVFGFSFLLVLMLWCCSKNKTTTAVVQKTELLEYIKVTRKNVKTFIPSLCDTFAIEFEGLYTGLESLPGVNQDSIFIDDILIEKGFKVVNSGWGNWQYGPRLIMLELTRDSCYCSVYKKYYDKKDSNTLKVSERLVCNTREISGV